MRLSIIVLIPILNACGEYFGIIRRVDQPNDRFVGRSNCPLKCHDFDAHVVDGPNCTCECNQKGGIEATFGFYGLGWRCISNSLLQGQERCKVHFGENEKSDNIPIFPLKGHTKEVNKDTLDPAQENCTLLPGGVKVYDCTGQWRNVEGSGFTFGVNQMSSFYFVKINLSTGHQLEGKLVKLDINCRRTNGHTWRKPASSCLLFKLEGNQNCSNDLKRTAAVLKESSGYRDTRFARRRIAAAMRKITTPKRPTTRNSRVVFVLSETRRRLLIPKTTASATAIAIKTTTTTTTTEAAAAATTTSTPSTTPSRGVPIYNLTLKIIKKSHKYTTFLKNTAVAVVAAAATTLPPTTVTTKTSFLATATPATALSNNVGQDLEKNIGTENKDDKTPNRSVGKQVSEISIKDADDETKDNQTPAAAIAGGSAASLVLLVVCTLLTLTAIQRYRRRKGERSNDVNVTSELSKTQSVSLHEIITHPSRPSKIENINLQGGQNTLTPETDVGDYDNLSPKATKPKSNSQTQDYEVIAGKAHNNHGLQDSHDNLYENLEKEECGENNKGLVNSRLDVPNGATINSTLPQVGGSVPESKGRTSNLYDELERPLSGPGAALYNVLEEPYYSNNQPSDYQSLERKESDMYQPLQFAMKKKKK